MTFEIGLVFFILGAALVLFITEIIPMDLVALLVLAVLALSGLVSPAGALAGFSNPAVITVWAMFILSAGLTRTGVAAVIGRVILGWTSHGEVRAIVVISLTAAVLSAFMNNIGVAALMLPAVVTVARRSGIPPSRLLMPLAYGSLLGGLTTLIGTPPNLLVSNALRERGLQPFDDVRLHARGWRGAAGRPGIRRAGGTTHPAPARPGREASPHGPQELAREYRLGEGSASIRIPQGSPLAGRTLRESRLGSAARLNVFTVQRGSRVFPAPSPDFVLAEHDVLHTGGALDRFQELRGWSELVVDSHEAGIDAVVSAEIGLAELLVLPGAPIVGRTLQQADFRKKFSRAIVVAIQREETVIQSGIALEPLREGDRLLVLMLHSEIDALSAGRDFDVFTSATDAELTQRYDLREHLLSIKIPEDSALVGKRLAESRLGDALGVGVLAMQRGTTHLLLPGPDEVLTAEDLLFVRGTRSALDIFHGLQGLVVESESIAELSELDSDRAVLVEALLSPRTSLVGKSAGELRFRERYGLQVLAVLRRGEVHRSDLRDLKLEFGDALLLIGPSDRARLLEQDGDFLLVSRDVEPTASVGRAPLAVLIMLAVIVPVLLGWLPIAISAVSGAALMVLTRCISMDEAYRAIEWRSIFLIAGMLPLGTALADTGAAALAAETIVAAVGPMGPWAVLVALCLITSAGTTVIPTAALVVLLAPIALTASEATGLSPYAVMMAIAMAASASFTSPVSHPANVLVMGPGGYRFADYVKLGVPLTIVVLLIVFLVLPFAWPLAG